jgi:dienelactone hydrolase
MNAKNDYSLPQAPIQPRVDLRMMLRNHVVRRSLDYMEAADARRLRAIESGNLEEYQSRIRNAVLDVHGTLPAGPAMERPRAVEVSTYEKEGYRIENVLFESFPGWEVNATVYVPLDFQPPFKAVVVPVGHSGKQFPNYQLPCQFFARSGFLAITFDPPGQAGEKQTGNDHFRDGVRCFLVGETSSRYFVADALRCIDYLETRKDADLSPGVAMTGVSGGGTTTIFSGVIDPRITVTGPSCCLSPLEDLAIRQCYSACPEGRMWRRYADGIDYVDIIGATAPKPTLIMAGKGDEVFRIEDTTVLAETARSLYRAGGCGNRFDFFADESGHAYTLIQAERFAAFMDKWLGSGGDSLKPKRRIWKTSDFRLNPYAELQCKPRQDVNMRTLSLVRAVELRGGRSTKMTDPAVSAAQMCGWRSDYPEQVQSEVGPPFRAWVHDWRQVRLVTEGDIELHGSLVTPAGREHAPVVLHFDDLGRNRLLEAGGILVGAIRFVDRENPQFGCFSVDLRGWGDTRPTLLPYEAPSWGSTERFFAYSTAALGDSTMHMRVRDGLAARAFLAKQPATCRSPVIVTGCGLGAIVASHVAAIDRQVAAAVFWDSLGSFELLLEADDTLWSPECFVPLVLKHYDLPDLLASAGCPVTWINPLDAMKLPLVEERIDRLADAIGPQAKIERGTEDDVCSAILEHLEKADLPHQPTGVTEES